MRESLPFFDGGKEGHGGVEVEQALEGGKSEGERKGHRLIVGDVGERGFWEGLAREKVNLIPEFYSNRFIYRFIFISV